MCGAQLANRWSQRIGQLVEYLLVHIVVDGLIEIDETILGGKLSQSADVGPADAGNTECVITLHWSLGLPVGKS